MAEVKNRRADESGLHAGYDAALAKLQSSSLRTTAPRRAILRVLANEHGPFTIEEIHDRLEAGCDLATVYRSISALEEIGVIARCDFGEGAYRYEMAGDNRHHHHHLVCKKCQKAVPLEATCNVETLESSARHLGYDDISHSLEIFGICPDCQKALNK